MRLWAPLTAIPLAHSERPAQLVGPDTCIPMCHQTIKREHFPALLAKNHVQAVLACLCMKAGARLVHCALRDADAADSAPFFEDHYSRPCQLVASKDVAGWIQALTNKLQPVCLVTLHKNGVAQST